MKSLAALLLLSCVFALPAWSDADPISTGRTCAEVLPLLADMSAAANAHDVGRHVGFYAHDASVTLIYNGIALVGWETIRDKQREWWKNGKSDVAYRMRDKPDCRAPAPDVVITTLFMQSRRTMPSGDVTEGEFAVSSVWQKRQEGWRVIYSHESTTR